MSERPCVYVAGPMTGYPGFNYGAFHNAAELLSLLGYHVLNPARHGFIDGYTWTDYMRLGIVDVARSQGVCLLSNWGSSRGAVLEVHIAHALGLPTIPLARWTRETL